MKMYLIQLVLLALVIFSHDLSAQSSFQPENLGANVNSDYSEINPILSPDGKILYFNRVNHPENNFGEFDSQDIWMSVLQEDGTWAPAEKLPSSINKNRNNAILSITENGNTILINGIYDKNNNWKKRGLSVCQKTENGEWGPAQKLDIKAYGRKNQGESSNAYLSNDGLVIVLSLSKRWNGKKNNLFVTKKNPAGDWSAPKKLKKPINTRYKEEAPFLSEDGNTMYFTSNRKKGKGESDIYYSIRKDGTSLNWTDPLLLSDTINSAQYESYYKTNLKGSWAYFCSTKNSLGKSDIYKVKLFEENPFVLISGKIINKTTGDPFIGKSSYSIQVNGHIVDSITVNPETAEYSIRLPLDAGYKLEAPTKNYTSFPEVVDVNGIKEFTQVTQNLMVESFPYILLKGKIYETATHSPIHAGANPKIWLDDIAIDSAIIHPDGTYEVKIAFGKKYNLQAVADKFTPIVSPLDLTSVKEYEVMTMDLPIQMMKQNIAVIQGKVMDNKTLQPLSSVTDFYIQVNGSIHHAYISKDSAYYRIELDLGNNYVINAFAPNYYPVFEIIQMKEAHTFITLHKDLYITPIEVGQTVKLNNIFFPSGKTTLKKESYPELNKVVTFLKDNPAIKIEIGGHTDNVGSAASNLKLSQGRAASVEVYLESKGIAKDRIHSQGYGLTKPVAENTTPEGKASNRRVEFTIMDK